MVNTSFGQSYTIAIFFFIKFMYISIAATLMQSIKAILLLGATVLLAVLVLAQFGFNSLALFQAVADKYGAAVWVPDRQVNSLDAAIFPLDNPGIVSIPLSLITAIVISFLNSKPSAIEKSNEVEQQIHTEEILVNRASARSGATARSR